MAIPKFMMTSLNGNISRVTGPLCGEFTSYRWIPLKKASDAELWCFFLSAPDAHYDVIVMWKSYINFILYMSAVAGILAYRTRCLIFNISFRCVFSRKKTNKTYSKVISHSTKLQSEMLPKRIIYRSALANSYSTYRTGACEKARDLTYISIRMGRLWLCLFVTIHQRRF